MDTQFDDLRPYYDSEINAAMQRLTADPLFQVVAERLYPGVPVEMLKAKFLQLNNVLDFQVNVMHHAVKQIIKSSITHFTYHGFNQLDPSKNYLFVSNHRDIMLDSALFQIALYEMGFRTSEITFGSNLMKPEFVVEIGKSNKMFKVERGGNPRDFYRNSMHLSDYIRYTITQKGESIWIAQRNGRTKDGNDATDQGILKMFAMSGSKNLVDNLSELNIVPLAISYQWEPCDVQKTNELYISRNQKYEKAPGEDLQSILYGINQFKGDVHIEVCQPLTRKILDDFCQLEKNDFYNSITTWMDQQILSNYKLCDTNYIAYDLLEQVSTYRTHYSNEALTRFKAEMETKLAMLKGERDELRNIYLGIYANPVKNALKQNLNL